jgi:hypothetical protein
MRRCFIHIGTHKTGTTSIQHLLSRNSPALQQKGFYYPNAGRLEKHPGQHNLAWQISGDHRFQDDYGTIDDLIKEVKDSSDDIILSSEDFECSLYHPAKFSGFISLLQSHHFLVTVILYVRNQVDYLARLYLTLLHFKLDLTFDELLGPTLDQGEFRWHDWIFNFDYSDLLRRIEENENVGIIVRSYDQARTSVCGDFLSIFNITLRDFDVDEEVFANMSLPLKEYVGMFLWNRTGRQLLEDEARAIENLISQEASTIELSPLVTSDLFQRFKQSNRNLFINYGIPEPKMENTDGVQNSPQGPYIDKLFNENIDAFLSEPFEKRTKARREGS